MALEDSRANLGKGALGPPACSVEQDTGHRARYVQRSGYWLTR